MKIDNIAFVAAQSPTAQHALLRLKRRYDCCPVEEAGVIVTLGGDGFMLESLHRYMKLNKPLYGMNRGSVGFLMNHYLENDLPRRLSRAQRVTLHPLRMIAQDIQERRTDALAINEVSLLRQTRQAAKLRIRIDGKIRLPELICDGALVCTAAGSTAYNLSAHGPILPMGANVMALTPISAFRPRRWRGAILPHTACVEYEVLEQEKRPVSAVADYTEVRRVAKVEVREDRGVRLSILCDPEHDLEERILSEQFSS